MSTARRRAAMNIAGWEIPGGNGQTHFFPASPGGKLVTSLCGRAGSFPWPREEENGTRSKQECRDCRKLLLRQNSLRAAEEQR